MAYESFASVYDIFMEHAPYDRWTKNILSILKRRDIACGIGLDLGCGTGQITRRLAAAGFDMIGADASPEMLDIARKKGPDEILYLCQDMRSFELYGTVAFCTAVCDSLNYLTSPAELEKVFSLVYNYLDPGGMLIFDLNTEYKYREVLSDNTFAENREEGSFIWENYYDPGERLNEYDLTLFIRDGEELFRRYQETHLQHAFLLSEVRKALSVSGLILDSVFDITEQDIDPEAEPKLMEEGAEEAFLASERLLFAAHCEK